MVSVGLNIHDWPMLNRSRICLAFITHLVDGLEQHPNMAHSTRIRTIQHHHTDAGRDSTPFGLCCILSPCTTRPQRQYPKHSTHPSLPPAYLWYISTAQFHQPHSHFSEPSLPHSACIFSKPSSTKHPPSNKAASTYPARTSGSS